MHEDERQLLCERISALADGQLDDDALAHTVTLMSVSGEARGAWHTYHLVGDVLRCPDLADCGRDQAFMARFRERLAQAEPPGVPNRVVGDGAVPVVEPMRVRPVESVQALVMPVLAAQAANDAVVRWKWLAAAASLMAVAVLGWHLGTLNPALAPVLATAPANQAPATAGATIAGVAPPVMVRDPRLDELLAAHRQFGGTSALQMPAGFLRNATFEPVGR